MRKFALPMALAICATSVLCFMGTAPAPSDPYEEARTGKVTATVPPVTSDPEAEDLDPDLYFPELEVAVPAPGHPDLSALFDAYDEGQIGKVTAKASPAITDPAVEDLDPDLYFPELEVVVPAPELPDSAERVSIDAPTLAVNPHLCAVSYRWMGDTFAELTDAHLRVGSSPTTLVNLNAFTSSDPDFNKNMYRETCVPPGGTLATLYYGYAQSWGTIGSTTLSSSIVASSGASDTQDEITARFISGSLDANVNSEVIYHNGGARTYFSVTLCYHGLAADFYGLINPSAVDYTLSVGDLTLTLTIDPASLWISLNKAVTFSNHTSSLNEYVSVGIHVG